MKGGSYASDAVVGSVDAAAFVKMNKTFTNAFEQKGGRRKRAQKGGSIASNEVVSGVKAGTFEAMNANFTNVVSHTQKGGRCARCPSCGKVMKGGENIPTFESIMSNANRIVSGAKNESFIQPLQFRSEPANVPSSDVVKLIGGPAPAPAPFKGGFNKKLKNINEYMNKGKYQVFNRHIGGGDDGATVKVGLNTTDSILSNNKTHGIAPERVPNTTTLNIIANEEINAPMPMLKTSHFGDVTGLIESETNFNYDGKGGSAKQGKKAKAAKAAKTAKATPKKKRAVASAMPKKM